MPEPEKLINQIRPSDEPAGGWGSAASATVGRVTAEVDEALTTPDRQLSLDTPVIYLRLKIDGPDMIARLHEFLTAHSGSGAAMEFALGVHGSLEVELLRDDEPGQRFFIVVGGCGDSSLRLTLEDEECRQWRTALEEVQDQLRG